MATTTAGYVWVSGEVVTPAKMNSAAVPTISNIVNADVSATAAIAGSKVSPNFAAQNVVTTGAGGFRHGNPRRRGRPRCDQHDQGIAPAAHDRHPAGRHHGAARWPDALQFDNE
jgi:hypothetical protein